MGMVVDSGSAAQPVLGVFLMRKALLAGVAALLLGREAVAEPIIVANTISNMRGVLALP
jgi:hypothetical protein